ncbi:MAG: DUF190 domain-containing protein [Cyclobacteriaceae bacterium]|jgi:PII-like signaling protein|nr:DUF190 domain-containing protein [Cyclobacteriaceae bacterium]
MLQAQLFIDLEEQVGDQLLHDYVMRLLAEEGIAGATSFRGYAGFGRNHRIKYPRDLFSFDEPPALVVFVDEDDRVERAAKKLKVIAPSCLMVIFPVLKI